MSSRQVRCDKVKGENRGQVVRKKFFQVQQYGAKKAMELKLTEKEIEKLIFEDR